MRAPLRTATPCPQHQLLLWDSADFVTATGAPAHAHTGGAWKEQSQEGTPGPRLHRLLLQQCHGTGGSLFITVFIVLGAACLVLERGSRAAGGGEGAPSEAQSCLWVVRVGHRATTLGTGGAFGTLCCRQVGEGEYSCRDRHAKNTTTQRKPLLGTLQPLSRIWHFLHLPPALGPRHVWSPQNTFPILLSIYIYIYPQAGTGTHQDYRGDQVPGQGVLSVGGCATPP